MVTPTELHVIPAAEAADLALITYRQLDHWARQGWVEPSLQAGSGRGGRRLYSVDDVLRLAALRHFAKAGWPVKDLGSQLPHTDVAGATWLVAGTESGLVSVDDVDELHELFTNEERFTVYDLRPLRARITGPAETTVSPADTDAVPLRRLA
ncbi:MAG: MerR family transcriptional regulator [Actinomycetia bacterium]|nr:MerR family transcriptional regulator [Actinomycetes bacterium]